MGKRKRQWIDATDDWQQLHLLTTSTEQRLYELIRPIVLFGHSSGALVGHCHDRNRSFDLSPCLAALVWTSSQTR